MMNSSHTWNISQQLMMLRWLLFFITRNFECQETCLSNNMSDVHQIFLLQQDGYGIIDLLLFLLIII